MYAIVNIAGQQYKVEKEQKLFVHRLAEKEGETVQFNEVLLIDNDKEVLIGEPTLKGAVITGKILTHPKADKVQVFKKKKRKGYKVLRGHRQYMTEIQIQEILEKGATVTARPKAKADKPAAKEKTKAGATKADTKAETPKKPVAEKKTASATGEKTAAAQKPAAKKPVAKKPAAKKPAAKKPAAKKEASGTKTTGKAAPGKSGSKASPAKKKDEGDKGSKE
jgi:large subunit ribosomal protein L21